MLIFFNKINLLPSIPPVKQEHEKCLTKHFKKCQYLVNFLLLKQTFRKSSYTILKISKYHDSFQLKSLNIIYLHDIFKLIYRKKISTLNPSTTPALKIPSTQTTDRSSH